jgi:two-component system sensor histidine kinase QseC
MVLLGSIAAATFFAWGTAAYFSFLDTRHEINELFDAHLAESARAILQQADHESYEGQRRHDRDEKQADDGSSDDEEEPADFSIPEVRSRGILFEKRLQFQLWTATGVLLMDSRRDSLGKALTLSATDGFSQGESNDKELRAFSAWNRDRTLNIQVAEPMDTRNGLINSSVRNVLTPLFLMIFPLLLALAIMVEYALRPLRRLSAEVERRTSDDLSSIDERAVPREIRPIIDALNHLFSRLSRALANERRFTADAAHELRTPLAAIKTQAQVALRSTADAEVQQHALLGVSSGVDRATHLVEQLLTLARLDPDTELHGTKVKLRTLAADVLSKLVPDAGAKNLELAIEDGPEVEILGNRALLEILLRNLVDNAIRYTPVKGSIHVSIERLDGGAQLIVADNGPGLSDEQRKFVMQRFSRLSRPSGEGSGLGLSIVNRIVELHRAKLLLGTNETGPGLRVVVNFSS